MSDPDNKSNILNTHKKFYDNRPPLDVTFYNNNYNDLRRSRVMLILCCLESNEQFKSLSRDIKLCIVRRIERSCYNKTCEFISQQGQALNWENIHFVNYYNITALRIQKNIECGEHNSDLINLICQFEDKPSNQINNIAYMASNELQPSISESIYNIISERRKQKIQKKISTQHKCFSCGFSRTTEIEIQSRSLDEGSTLIVTCETEGCSNRWTISS